MRRWNLTGSASMWRHFGERAFCLAATADEPIWSYEAIARRILAEAESALDMGTGEGGVLASLAPLPRLTVAYEEWWPTVPAAVATLRPHRFVRCSAYRLWTAPEPLLWPCASSRPLAGLSRTSARNISR
jgi:hypothetical protein